MNRTLPRLSTLAIVLLAAGCLGSPAPTEDAQAAPSAPALPNANPEAPDASNASTHSSDRIEAFGIVGNETTTRSEALTYFVTTRGPVTVTLRFNGTLLDSRIVEGRSEWNLTLPYGRRDLNVSFQATGLTQHHNVSLVRLGSTLLRLDYGSYHPSYPGTPRKEQLEIWIDVDDRPSAPLYAAVKAQHKDAFVAHDQLVLFEALAKKKVEYRWNPSFQQFSVDRIDGAGNPVTASAPPWWCYKVNGKSADGITIQVVRPGDVVDWNLGTCT